MQQAAARPQNKLILRPDRHFTLRLLVCLLIIAILFPCLPIHAQTPTPESEGLLIYKAYNDPTPVTYALPVACSGENCNSGSTSYYKPFTPFISSNVNASPVENPSLWPYAATVKILSHWPSGATSTCSGSLVDAKYVLTAAHCIYSFTPDYCNTGDATCWVEDIEATPAYQGGEAPAGRSGYETIMTWTSWTENRMGEYDLAAIKLRYPLGAQVGWLGAGYDLDNVFFTDNTFALYGYPEAAPQNGQDMTFWSGQASIFNASDDLLQVAGNFDLGWEGATLNAENGVAYGVISSINNGTDVTLTRITYTKFDAIRTFIQEGQPKEDGGNLTTFFVQAEPEWNFPGQALTGTDFILWNYSNSPLPYAVYSVDIYISADNLITSTDTYLDTVSYEGAFEANQGIRLTPEQNLFLPEEFHSSGACGGTFYIGALANFPDSNPTDNATNYYQPKSLWIFNSDNSNYLFPIWY